MEIVDVVPKEIHVVFALTLKEIELLLNALDNCTIEKECTPESKMFLTGTFFKKLDELSDQLKRTYGNGS
jgi:hypothetical protein